MGYQPTCTSLHRHWSTYWIYMIKFRSTVRITKKSYSNQLQYLSNIVARFEVIHLLTESKIAWQKSAMVDPYSGFMKSGLDPDPLSGSQKKAIATNFNT